MLCSKYRKMADSEKYILKRKGRNTTLSSSAVMHIIGTRHELLCILIIYSAPGDYVELEFLPLTFSPSLGLQFAITIVINDDDISEEDEQFFVRAEPGPPGVIIMPDASTVTILDNDSKSYL